MTAAQAAKAAGLKSLSQMAEITGQSPQTLINWFKNKPQLFDVVLNGCRVMKPREIRESSFFMAYDPMQSEEDRYCKAQLAFSLNLDPTLLPIGAPEMELIETEQHGTVWLVKCKAQTTMLTKD
jgi:hypothetical protein